VYNLGIGEKSEQLDFYIPNDLSLTTVSSFNLSFFNNHSNNQAKKVEIQTINLDSFCFDNNIYPDFIKIDVEGHEEKVFRGAQKLLQKYRPIILCEVFTRQYESISTFKNELPQVSFINDLLYKLDYEIFIIKNSSLIKLESLNTNNSYRNFLFLPTQK